MVIVQLDPNNTNNFSNKNDEIRRLYLLVTGASGFIDSKLLNELTKRQEFKDGKYAVRCMIRNKLY